MSDIKDLFVFHLADGLREGLSHFSQTSRAALLYAFGTGDPMRVYDPQNLLQDHKPKIDELYCKSEDWRRAECLIRGKRWPGLCFVEDLGLAGLLSWGGRSEAVPYQMWFTEHHPDMCNTGPTHRWLEYAVVLLSQDVSACSPLNIGASGYVLREYATHAVRDYIVDQRNMTIGLDTKMRVYPVLDAVLGISETVEEGEWAHGTLAFVEPDSVQHKVNFLARFPDREQPKLKKLKHVRKLLQAVEFSNRVLVSDGVNIIGVAEDPMPRGHIRARFVGTHGYLHLDDTPICSFYDGNFHSTTRQAKLVEVEEILYESTLPAYQKTELFKIIATLVHNAQDRRHGCTLVIDLDPEPATIPGQSLSPPLDLRNRTQLELAQSLSKIDGALYIRRDQRLHAFACLLDGLAVPGESRSRGARFNSAVRFTARHENLFIVVVSADRPVSIIQKGIELNTLCDYLPPTPTTPPTLEQWLDQ